MHSAGKSLTKADVAAALDLYEIDERGLDRLDRALLRAIIERFNGGPVGLTTMAMSVGEEAETIESVCEPFLLRSGLWLDTERANGDPKRMEPSGFNPTTNGQYSAQFWRRELIRPR